MQKGVLYLWGDFKINLLDYGLHNNTQYFVDHLFSVSLFSLVNKPNRLSNHCHSIIDNIFTNALNIDASSGIMLDYICFHLTIFCILKFNISMKL